MLTFRQLNEMPSVIYSALEFKRGLRKSGHNVLLATVKFGILSITLQTHDVWCQGVKFILNLWHQT